MFKILIQFVNANAAKCFKGLTYNWTIKGNPAQMFGTGYSLVLVNSRDRGGGNCIVTILKPVSVHNSWTKSVDKAGIYQ